MKKRLPLLQTPSGKYFVFFDDDDFINHTQTITTVMQKIKQIWHKILVILGIRKQIILTSSEKQWLRLIKGYCTDKYRTNASNWIETIKPLFKEIYGWDPDVHKDDFLHSVFNRFLNLYLKIQYDKSGDNVHLNEVFKASFTKSIRRNYELPIERAIAELCGQIQAVPTIENGIKRFEF